LRFQTLVQHAISLQDFFVFLDLFSVLEKDEESYDGGPEYPNNVRRDAQNLDPEFVVTSPTL
jgi:hypothetical protein